MTTNAELAEALNAISIAIADGVEPDEEAPNLLDLAAERLAAPAPDEVVTRVMAWVEAWRKLSTAAGGGNDPDLIHQAWVDPDADDPVELRMADLVALLTAVAGEGYRQVDGVAWKVDNYGQGAGVLLGGGGLGRNQVPLYLRVER